MVVSAVIPARLASTRLPRKVLLRIAGQPMLWHVWHNANSTGSFDVVYIVTDSEEIGEAAAHWGANVVMTEPNCSSGSDRIASALSHLDGDFIVNVQADEPLLKAEYLDQLGQSCLSATADVDIVTAVFRITQEDDIDDPNVVKVVRANDGRALYFSRNTVPHVFGRSRQSWLQHNCFWGHIGVYGYRRSVLEMFRNLSESVTERAESLEQLRLLDAGFTFSTIVVNYAPIGVDTQQDLTRVRQILESRG